MSRLSNAPSRRPPDRVAALFPEIDQERGKRDRCCVAVPEAIFDGRPGWAAKAIVAAIVNAGVEAGVSEAIFDGR